MDELNLYDDLDEFQEQQEKKSKELQNVEEKYQQSLKTIEELREENKTLTKNIKRIETSFQSLLDTARTEIKRKDKEIERLRKEKDDICFRRKIPQNTCNSISENQQLLHDTANNPVKSDNIGNNKEIPTIDPSKKRNTEVKKRHRDRDEHSHTSDYKRHRGARYEYDDKYDQSSNKHTKIKDKSDDSKRSKDLYRDTYKDSNYRRDYNRNRSCERKYYDKTSSSNVHSQSSKSSESPESYARYSEISRNGEGDKYKHFERNRSHDYKNCDKYSKLSRSTRWSKNTDPKADDYQHEKSYKRTETDKCHKQIDKDLGKQKSNVFKGREESKNPISVQGIKHKKTYNLLDDKANTHLPADNTINAKNLKEHNELERTKISPTTDNIKIVAIDKELDENQKVQSEKELNKQSESINLETLQTLNQSSMSEPSKLSTPRKLALFNKLFGETPSESSSTDSSCKSSNSLLANIKGILAKSSPAELISSATTSPGEYTDISSGKQTPKENFIEPISSESNTPVANKAVNDEPPTSKRMDRKYSVDIDIDNCFILTSNIPKNVETIAYVDLTEIVDDQIENDLELIEIPGLDLCCQSINKTNISSKTQDKSIPEYLNFASQLKISKDKCNPTTKDNNSELNDELKSLDENFTENLNERHKLSLETYNKKETTNNVNTETEGETANIAETTTERDSCNFNETLENASTSLSLQLSPFKQQHVAKETTTANAENKKGLSSKHVQLKKLTEIADNIINEVVIVDTVKSCSILSFQNPNNTERENQPAKYECSAEEQENVNETSTQHVQEKPTTKSSTLDNFKTSVETQMQIMHTNLIPNVKRLSLLEDEDGNKNRAKKAAKDELHANSEYELNDNKLIDESNIEAVTHTFLSSENSYVREEDQHSFSYKSAANKTFATENIPATKSNIKDNSADIIVESDEQPESTSVAGTSKVITSAEIVENIKQSNTVTVLEASKVVQIEPHNLSSLIESTAFSSFSHNVTAASVGTKGIDKDANSNKIRDSDLLENSNNNKPSSSDTKMQLETASLETETSIEDDLNDIKIVENDKGSEATATDDLSDQNIPEAIQREEKDCSLIEENYGQILPPLTDNPTSSSLSKKLDNTGNPFEANVKDSTAVESTESDEEKLSIQENQSHLTELALEVLPKDATDVEIIESDLTVKSMYVKENSSGNNENDQETSLKSTVKDISQDSTNEQTSLESSNSTASKVDGSKMAYKEIYNKIQEKTTTTNDSIREIDTHCINIADLDASEKTSSIRKNHTEITPVTETCLKTYQIETLPLKSCDSLAIETNKDKTTAKIVSVEVKEITSSHGNDETKSQEETIEQIELHIAQTATTDPANEDLTFKANVSITLEWSEDETIASSGSNNMDETTTNSFDLETQLITSTHNTNKETSNVKSCDSVIPETEKTTAQDSKSLTPKVCDSNKHIDNLEEPTLKITDLVSKDNTNIKYNEAINPIPHIVETCLKTLRIELKSEEKNNKSLKPFDMTKNNDKIMADKSDSTELREKPSKKEVANEETIRHKDNAIQTVSHGIENTTNKVLESSISEEPQQMEFQDICHQLSESNGLQYYQAILQTFLYSNQKILKDDNAKTSTENSMEVKTKPTDQISTKTDAQKLNIAEEAAAEISNLNAERPSESSLEVETNLTDHNRSKIDTVTTTEATQNLPKENQVDVVLKPHETNFSETLKKHLKEYFTNKAENYYKSNNKNISLKENKHKINMFPKAIQKCVLETDWSQTTKCLEKPIFQINSKLSAPKISKVAIEKSANEQAMFKKCHNSSTAIVKTSAVIATPKNDSLKNKQKHAKSNEITGQLINDLKEASAIQTIEQNATKDFQAKHTDIIASYIPESNAALETPTKKGKPGEEASKLNDTVINTTQEILNMKNSNKNQISVKSTEMKVQQQILPCKSQVENTEIIDNQIHNDSKITVLPAGLNTGNQGPIKTKDSFLNVSIYPAETLNICTPFKKLITKEINIEGEIVEVVKIQILKDSNATNSNITHNIMENIKKQQSKATEILTEVEGSSSKDQQALKLVTKSNNLSVPTNEYITEQNTPEMSIKELASEEKAIEKSHLKECQKARIEIEELAYQTPTKLPNSTGDLKLIHKIVQEKDNFNTISSNLTEMFTTHPALPSISTTSPTPSNFSGIFSKKSSSLVSTEDDFTKSKKKSLHFIAKPKEYILPAASVLCNVDNLENATKTNKKLHWELLDNKNEMTEIEDDADIDTTDEEEPKIKEEPLENTSTLTKQCSPHNKTSSHKLQKSSLSETETQTEYESLNDLRRKTGIYKKINFKRSKVHKPNIRKHKLSKTVKARLKSGIPKTDTFINAELMIQQPFSILFPKRPVGRPRKLKNCVTIKKLENTLPKKKRGRKPKQIMHETPNESLQDIQQTKTSESIEKNKKSTAKKCHQQKQEETNKTITADFKTDLESLHSRERYIPHIYNMENSIQILSTSVERLDICDESCNSNDSVKQRKSLEKVNKACKYEELNNISMIYHKQDFSTKDISTLIKENPATESLKQLEIKDNTEILSVKNKFLENNIASESLKKHQDVSSSSKETQEKRDYKTNNLSTDKTDLGSVKNSYIKSPTVISITKHHEVTSSNRETQERCFSKKSYNDPKRVFSDDLCEDTRKEKSLKSKTLTKPLMKNKLKNKIKNKVTNFISLEDIGIKVTPLKSHLSSYRIPKIKKDTEETINNSWKLETYVEFEKKGGREQVKQTAEHAKESNAMETVINKNDDCQKDKQQSPKQNFSKEQLTKNIKENSQQARSNNIKPLANESNVEAVQEQLNKQQSKGITASSTTYINNFDNKTKTGQRQLFSPDMYDEQAKKDPEETTRTENNSFKTYKKQCLYLSETHELNPVKLRRKSLHTPKKFSDSSLNTNSNTCETNSSNECTKPRRKSMNVHRTVLDSSCDKDDDTDKQSANEINKKQTISKTVADLQTNFKEQKLVNYANEKEVKKPLRGRRKSMFVESSALEAVESEESVTNTSSKALRRKSMYVESCSALETVVSEEKETNLRRKVVNRQSIYVERPASETVEFEEKDTNLRKKAVRRQSMYVENTTLDMSPKSLTPDFVQKCSKNMKQDGKQNVEISKTLSETSIKAEQTTKPITSFKMRRKSMYVERNSLNNEEVVKDKTEEKLENKAEESSEQINLVSKSPIIVTQKKLSNSLNKLKDSSQQIETDSDSQMLLSQQNPNKMRRKSTNQRPNLDIISGHSNFTSNPETRKDSVQVSYSEQELKKTLEKKSSQQRDSGSELSVKLAQQKSITMRRKSTNQLHYLESTRVNKEDSIESKKSKQDVVQKTDSQQTAADFRTTNALTQPKSIKIPKKSTIERQDLGTINDDKNSRTNEETKMDSVESHKSKQEVDKKSKEKILPKSEFFVVATQEDPIKMRGKSTIEQTNVEAIDTSEANKSIQVLQTKSQDMIPTTDDIEEMYPCCSSSVTKSQTLTKRRKSTNQPQITITDTSNADKKQEPGKDTIKHSNLTGQSSRGKATDSDSSIVRTQHKSIKMRRKSTNQRRILDSSSDDNESLIKTLPVITNEHKIPLTAAVTPRQHKRRSVKVLSTSLESPANTSQSSSCQISPFNSPTLNHPIFSTEVPMQTNEFAASMPMISTQQDDNKFKEIDSKLHEIFKSPQYTVDYKISTILPSPPINESKSNVTIEETLDCNKSSINMSQLNGSTSILNDTSATQNGSEIKHLSLGTANYRFEKVSDNVINLFISRKRKRKRNN